MRLNQVSRLGCVLGVSSSRKSAERQVVTLSSSDEDGSASEKLQPPLMRAIRIAPESVSTALSSQKVGAAVPRAPMGIGLKEALPTNSKSRLSSSKEN